MADQKDLLIRFTVQASHNSLLFKVEAEG